MDRAEDPLAALRAALEVSPDNLILRRHLADELCGAQRFEEAVKEFRELLAREPDDDELRLALAAAYLGQGKTGHADILVELVASRSGPGTGAAEPKGPTSAAALVLLARIRLAERDFRGARVAFRSACDLDPALESSDVAAELGVGLSNPFELEENLDDLDIGIAEPAGAGVGRLPVTLKDMGGFAALRNQLRLALVEPLARPDLFAAYASSTRGVLLAGPHGSGRTHLVRCVVGEAGLRLLELDLESIPEPGSPEWRNIIGDPTGAVILVSGLDSAASLESEDVQSRFDALFRLAAGGSASIVALTAAPWAVPREIVRRDQMDRMITVPLPTDVDRREILGVLLRSMPTESPDLKKVARKSAGLHVADLVEVVEMAVESAWQRAVDEGEVAPVREKSLISAARSMEATAEPWYESLQVHAEDATLARDSAGLARMLRRAAREN